jgi:hypothetical protein
LAVAYLCDQIHISVHYSKFRYYITNSLGVHKWRD